MQTEFSETKNSEIFELKTTIFALRDQMELLSHEKDAAVQKAVQKSSGEIKQLKKTTAKMRAEIEKRAQ